MPGYLAVIVIFKVFYVIKLYNTKVSEKLIKKMRKSIQKYCKYISKKSLRTMYI